MNRLHISREPRSSEQLSFRSFLPSAAIALVMGLVWAAGAGAQPIVKTVGDLPGCDFADIQLAVDFMSSLSATEKKLQIANNSTWWDIELSIADVSIELEGGYPDCSGVQAASPSPSALRGTALDSVVVIGSTGGRSKVTLKYLSLTNGVAAKGGGVKISGNVEVFLDQVRVEQNRSWQHGGGIYLEVRRSKPVERNE